MHLSQSRYSKSWNVLWQGSQPWWGHWVSLKYKVNTCTGMPKKLGTTLKTPVYIYIYFTNNEVQSYYNIIEHQQLLQNWLYLSWFINVFDRKIFRWDKVIVMSFVWVPFLIFNVSKNIKKAMVKNLAACLCRTIAVKNILR